MKLNGSSSPSRRRALGAVVNKAAIARQLKIMQEMKQRHSHHPQSPAPELLELCDSLGLLAVMNETFDMWRKKKTAHDYARYFPNGMRKTCATSWCATATIPPSSYGASATRC